MKILRTVEEVVEAIGSARVCELTGRDPGVVWHWYARANQFPAKTYVVLQKALKKRGYKAPDHLWNMTGCDKAAKMTKTLAEWDTTVRPHLNGIRDGAEMCARHTKQLLEKPVFDTLAFDALDTLEIVLATALVEVIYAKQNYQEKPTED